MTNVYIKNNSLAYAEYLKWKGKLTEHQQLMAEKAVIVSDRGMWCIQSSDDLINSHIGFGNTPPEAARDFLRTFIPDIEGQLL